MRPYRGIPIDDTEFIYGEKVELNKDLVFIVPKTAYSPINEEYKGTIWGCIQVKPETVGQSTGQEDKNKVEMYENDNVKLRDGRVFEITWVHSRAGFEPLNSFIANDIEVVNNIHQ